MKQTILLAFFLTLLLSLQAQKKPTVDKRLVGVEKDLEKLLTDWKAAGFAVAVVEKDKLVYAKGFGFRDYENKKPVTANTLFAIGSCTKAFTSSLLGLLAKDGKLSLDDKATAQLPGLSFYNDNMNNTISVRDMMTHRTGLPRHDYSWYLFKTNSRDSLLKRIRYQEPTKEIREKFQYNNFMFLTQGMIAEKISGKSWEENIREKIFTPLGMQASNFSVADMEKASDAALGYYVKDDSLIQKMNYYNIDAMGPAGSINSNVNEMANWAITWINGGKFNGKEVLPASYIKEAMSAQMVSSSALPGKENPDLHLSSYGFGWFLSSYRGHYRVEHGGNIDGFSASTSFFPSDSIGIIVLTNQNGSSVTSYARNILVDRMLQLKYIDWSGNQLKEIAKAKEKQKAEPNESSTSDKVAGTKPAHPLSDYEGLYTHLGYGTLDVVVKNDTLVSYVGQDSFYLRHYHYDVFEAKGYDLKEGIDTSAGGLRVTFRTGADGKIESATLPMEGELAALVFDKRIKPQKVSAADLQKYVGEYELSGVTVKVYVKEDTLFVFVPGQPDYETIAGSNHTFALKALKGFSIQFDVTDNNEVTAVNFVQPNGTFKAPKKK